MCDRAAGPLFPLPRPLRATGPVAPPAAPRREAERHGCQMRGAQPGRLRRAASRPSNAAAWLRRDFRSPWRPWSRSRRLGHDAVPPLGSLNALTLRAGRNPRADPATAPWTPAPCRACDERRSLASRIASTSAPPSFGRAASSRPRSLLARSRVARATLASASVLARIQYKCLWYGILAVGDVAVKCERCSSAPSRTSERRRSGQALLPLPRGTAVHALASAHYACILGSAT